MNKLTYPVQKIPVLRSKKGIKDIQQLFQNSCREYSGHIAYTTTTGQGLKTYSFSDIYDIVTRFASFLKGNDIGKGDHIALLSENRPEWAISYFACCWIGAVVIPLDARANADNHKFILGYSSAVSVICSDQFIESMNGIKAECPDLVNIISLELIHEIVADTYEGIDKTPVDKEDLCEILFTSGTTGTPKGVMLTHKNIMSNVEDVYSFLDINTNDTAFSVLPLHHCYECTGGLLCTFYSGVRVHYARGLKPNVLLEDLKIAKPTIWMNTPLILEKLYKRIKREIENQNFLKRAIIKVLPVSIIGKRIRYSLGLENIRYIVSGGAALPDWVQSGLENLGFPLIQGYGLSETAPLISANPPSKPRNESVGMIIESVDARIVDPDGECNGEICVKGPNVMKGYYKNDNDTNDMLTQDGWLKTGDIGYFDADGYLYITGRKRNIIVTRGGKNIFPEEVEDKLLESSLIEEIMVFSPDDESIQALVYPNMDEIKEIYGIFNIEDEKVHEIIKKEIRSISAKMESYKRVSKIAIKREEFPKTTTNKIKRYLFRDLKIDGNKLI